MVSAVLLAGCAAWAVRHVLSFRVVLDGGGSSLGELYAVTFAILALQVILYALDRPFRSRPGDQPVLDALNVTVAVPLYNEDAKICRRSLLSMLRQTRLPDHIYVTDDGSTAADYTAVRREIAARAAAAGVRLTWVRTVNGGKRRAQATAVTATPDADVYVTVDSDSILDRRAIAELLIPFADPGIESVAGVFLSANNATTTLARILDLVYLPAQLMVRGGMSVLGSVMVNSGAIAALRAEVFREALPVYLGETFFGVPVEFSDDSMLTLLAYLKGRTVQQTTAFGFAAMPDRFSFHRRQYLRWMRGSFIRSWWRFRYVPLWSYAWWQHFAGWAVSAVSLQATVMLYVIAPLEGRFSWTYLLIPTLLGYAFALPYLTVSRSDETFASRLLTFSLAPLAVLWSMTVLRAWRWWGAITCRKTGWGTRQGIELTLEDPK